MDDSIKLSSHGVYNIPWVEVDKPKIVDVPVVTPRQVRTGTIYTTQTVGSGPDKLDGPNSRIILSNKTTFVDSTDSTKGLQFMLSGITTNTTRVLTIPNITDTLVTLTAIQTLTGKTLDLTASASAVAYTAFNPSPTGYTGAVTINVARYIKVGKVVVMDIDATGTSNDTTLTITLPFAPKSSAVYHLTVTDNGSAQTASGKLSLTAASMTANLYKDLTGAVWTNANTKAFAGYGITYESN